LLKVQLQSKISQLDPSWRQLEDILTGDFFGVLDYLPRAPYLRDFIAFVSSMNPDAQKPLLHGVDWENVEIIFWPRVFVDGQNTEPDIVIISNIWVLVIEVKLGSSFGNNQPWREYLVGCQIAQERNIPSNLVYYTVLARNHLNIKSTFKADDILQLTKLQTVTSYVKWHEAVALIEIWLRKATAEHKRMLADLFKAMKKRRAIAFSGFKFVNAASVTTAEISFFCPPRFTGFLSEIPETNQIEDSLFLHNNDMGFIENCPVVMAPEEQIFLKQDFRGFGNNFSDVVQPKHQSMFYSKCFYGFGSNFPGVTRTHESVFFTSPFTAFLSNAPVCRKYNHIFQKG